MGWEGGKGGRINGGNTVERQCCARAIAARGFLREDGEGASVTGIQGGFSRVAGVVQYHFVLNLTCCAALS